MAYIFISLRFEERQGIIVTSAALMPTIKDDLGVEEAQRKAERRDEKGENVSI